jgi:NADP-dependent 3-hydroxy acid dehydrogenase YdfG
LVGVVKSAQLEFPKMVMRILSVSSMEFPESSARIIQLLEMEIELFDSDPEMEAHALYGDAADSTARRMVRRFTELTVPETRETIDTNPRLLEMGRGSYIITGGLGGLGLSTAKVLIEMGVRQLVLISRSGAVPYGGQGLEDKLAWLLNESGADVRVLRCDVSEESSVVALLESVRGIEGWTGGIRGVVHSAGVLRDAMIRGGKAASTGSDVWLSKAHSAQLLDKHTRQDSLDLFVCYSSIVASIGNIGQAAYGAANAYLDCLMQARARSGLCGLSIQWPAIYGAGMAQNLVSGSGNEATSTSVLSSGLTIQEYETTLSDILRSPTTAPVVTVCPRNLVPA